ncbi:LytTR family DNA-binding domain-containing protein [Spirosoma koreense]
MIQIIDPATGLVKIPGYGPLVPLDAIIRLQGECNYTWLHLNAPKKQVLLAKNLKWFEEQLPDFVRVHKSDLINPRFVQRYDRYNAKTLDVTLPGEHTIRVSRRRVDPVLRKLKHHQPQLG